MAEGNVMEKIVSLCKRRGFVYPASEIYGGINGFWDYGPLGSLLTAMCAATYVPAQQPPLAIKPLRPSQKASVMQTIGVTDITITYSRPAVKGTRLGPFSRPWRPSSTCRTGSWAGISAGLR